MVTIYGIIRGDYPPPPFAVPLPGALWCGKKRAGDKGMRQISRWFRVMSVLENAQSAMEQENAPCGSMAILMHFFFSLCFLLPLSQFCITHWHKKPLISLEIHARYYNLSQLMVTIYGIIRGDYPPPPSRLRFRARYDAAKSVRGIKGCGKYHDGSGWWAFKKMPKVQWNRKTPRVGIWLSWCIFFLTGEDKSTCPLCKGRGYMDDGTIDIRVRHRYGE